MKGKRKFFILTAIVLLAAAAVVVFMAMSRNDLLSVKVYKVSKGNISANTVVGGVVQSDYIWDLIFRPSAGVLDVLVNEGDIIKKGDVLAVVDVEEIKLSMEKLKLENSVAQTQLKILKESRGNSILDMEEQLNQINLDKKTLDNKIENLQKEVVRTEKLVNKNKTLYETGALAKLEYETALTQYEGVKDSIKSLNIEKEHLESQYNSTINKINKLKANKGTLESQIVVEQEKLKVTEIQRSILEKDLVNVNMETGEFISSQEGIIKSIGFKPGQLTSKDKPFFSIYNPENVSIKAKVGEEDALKIKVNNPVKITGVAFDKELEGRVTSINQYAQRELIDNQYMTVVDVEVEVLKGKEILLPGLNTDLVINTDNKEDVLLVHVDAIRSEITGEKYVYVVENDILKKRYIEVATTSDILAEVLNGLKIGEEVVYSSKGTLVEGEKVKVLR